MDRRTFVSYSSAAMLYAGFCPTALGRSAALANQERLSQPPQHHFFGYYGINPWDSSGRYHLALETDFDDRRPTPEDKAKVGFIDKTTHQFTPITQTPAFNLQQGSMMHWIDCGLGEEFTFNGYDEAGKLISYAVNFDTYAQRPIQGAIAAIAPQSDVGIGLNFPRMSFCRPTVGYATHTPETDWELTPNNDGLFSLDLKTGDSELMLSIQEVLAFSPTAYPRDRAAWFNHVLFNPSGERMLFFCRVRKPQKGFLTSLWTVNRDGSDLQCQIPFGNWVSHFDWKDEKTILVTSDIRGKREYLEFTDGKQDFKVLGEGILTVDGHCSYLPDPNWILSDTYALGPERLTEAFLFHIPTKRKVSLAKVHHPAKYKGVVRCDLHPRVSSDGEIVTVDSVYEGSRQIYLVDISGIK